MLVQTAAESSLTAQGQEQAHGVLGRGCKLCKLLSEPPEDPSCPHVSLVDYFSFLRFIFYLNCPNLMSLLGVNHTVVSVEALLE